MPPAPSTRVILNRPTSSLSTARTWTAPAGCTTRFRISSNESGGSDASTVGASPVSPGAGEAALGAGRGGSGWDDTLHDDTSPRRRRSRRTSPPRRLDSLVEPGPASVTGALGVRDQPRLDLVGRAVMRVMEPRHPGSRLELEDLLVGPGDELQGVAGVDRADLPAVHHPVGADPLAVDHRPVEPVLGALQRRLGRRAEQELVAAAQQERLVHRRRLVEVGEAGGPALHAAPGR